MRLLFSSTALSTTGLMDAFLSMLPLKGSSKVTIITTASVKFKSRNKHTQGLKERLEQNTIQVQLVDIEFQPPEVVKNSDAIILGGGNPYYLLYHIKRSGTDRVLKMAQADCLICGISAGGLVLQKDINLIDFLTPEMNEIRLEDKTGLGLVNEIILPHHDRFLKDRVFSEEQLSAYERENDCNVIRLGELEGIRFCGDKVEKIETYQ